MTVSTHGERARSRPLRRVFAVIALLTLSLVAPLLATAGPVDAHGAATLPGSRTYLCRIDGTSSGGDIEPKNPACAAAVQLGGKQPLWDWFGVLRGDGAGRTRGFIPDGRLCSGGEPKYAGYDLARADWPHTRLTGGAPITFRYNAWAAHPGEFRMYITRDGYDPTVPLRWDDLEAEPFSTYTQAQPNGNDAQNGTPDYQWPATLPNKTGRHIIYSVWERSDSAETFYNCSDVVFDGGNGEVVGLGAGAVAVSTPAAGEAAPAATTPSTSEPPGEAPSTTLATSTTVTSSTVATLAPSTPATADPSGVAERDADAGLAGVRADTDRPNPVEVRPSPGNGELAAPADGVVTEPDWTIALLTALFGAGLGIAGTVVVLAAVRDRRARL